MKMKYGSINDTDWQSRPSALEGRLCTCAKEEGIKMEMRRLTKAERETILLTSEAGDTWDIYTFNSSLKKRLQQFAAQHPDLCILKQEDKELGSVTYVIQKSRVSIRLIAPYSEERRRAVSAHAKEHGFGSQSP